MVVRSALSAERRCGAFASNLRRPPAKLSSARVASIRTPRFMTIMVLNQNPFDFFTGVPDASIRVALRGIRCPRCNGHGRLRTIALSRHPTI
jgi:hypothetical protein